MNIIEHLHEKYIFERRIRVLCENLAQLIPHNVVLLDVGCGDGFLAARLMQKRPDISIKGIDVLIRDNIHIPVEVYDGANLPYMDSSFDAVMFIDVLHHAEDPEPLLREAGRVARQAIIIKDHLLNGVLANSTLCFMDNIGNARHGVSLIYNYWSREKWMRTITSLDMSISEWRERLGIYQWPLSLIFDRSLHFISRLTFNMKD